MEGLRWVQLADEELDAFLGTGGTGVLAFGTNGHRPPVSFPVSYGYESTSSVFYFRLAFPPGSTRDDVVDDPVSFVTYDETDEGWRSVVATGYLEELSDRPHDSTVVQNLWAVEIPTVDVFDRPREDLEFRDFLLDPETMTGRKAVT